MNRNASSVSEERFPVTWASHSASPAAMEITCAGRVPDRTLSRSSDFNRRSSSTKKRRISSFGRPNTVVNAGRTHMYDPLV